MVTVPSRAVRLFANCVLVRRCRDCWAGAKGSSMPVGPVAPLFSPPVFARLPAAPPSRTPLLPAPLPALSPPEEGPGGASPLDTPLVQLDRPITSTAVRPPAPTPCQILLAIVERCIDT